MSTYVALLDKGTREETVEVKEAGPGLFEVTLRGKTRTVDAFRTDLGIFSLLVDGASYTATLDQRNSQVIVKIRGRSSFPVEILDERRLRMRRAAGKFTVEGRQLVTAPMPGKLVKVLVKPGDKVTTGQGILVVEAMKMENELKSPKDGVVTEVFAKEGQTVEGNAKLCAIE
jgi:biotin carboxyl carrier protein